MSEVTMCNMGLYRVGSSIRITSLDETVEKTEPVRQSAFWYPIVRDQLLQTAPWGFARKAVALATVSDVTYPGWGFVYQYPSDCLQAVAVCDSGGLRSNSFWWNAFFPWQFVSTNWMSPKIPFQVCSSADGNSNVIVTDIANAFLYYIFRQTVTNTYTPLFIDAFAWKFGSEVGASVQANPARIQRALNMYEPTLSRAMAQMMNEAAKDTNPDSPSISVRTW